jgi:beta-carotene ketolase (CrtO type)
MMRSPRGATADGRDPRSAGGGAADTGGEAADVVVVGGGHNGLVCAAYLARASLDVVVVEANDRCGGALFGSLHGGVVLEHGGVEHTTIVGSAIPDELDLERHGLRYAHRTLGAIHRFGDGTEIVIAETADATAASIRGLSGHDADAWLELCARSKAMFALVGALGEGRPVTMATLRRASRLLGSGDRALVELATSSVVDLAERWFEDPYVRAMAIARAGFSGLPAWAPGTGAVFCLTPAGHGRRYSRPIGGSAAFVDALVACVEAAGGRVQTSWRVASIHGEAAVGPGRCQWSVVSEAGERIEARIGVVTACAPQDALLGLVDPPELVPARLRRGLQRAEVVSSNLSQFTIAAALDAPPDLRASIDQADATMWWLLGEPADVMDGHVGAAVGRLPRRPGVLVTFPPAMDPTLAPSGRSSMWVNGFLARRLDGGRSWNSDDARIASEAVWSTIDRCLPGVRSRVTAEVFTSPDDLTERTGAANPGGHLAATLDQLMGGRPVRGYARHRAGVEGLYLTGAGTGQGPSISGLPGRSCAEALLDDLAAGTLSGRARQAVRAGRAEGRRARNLLRHLDLL